MYFITQKTYKLTIVYMMWGFYKHHCLKEKLVLVTNYDASYKQHK